MQSFEITGTVWIGRGGTAARECRSVVVYSPTRAQTWLYVDKDTNELVFAGEVDTVWHDIDLEDAREHFADVLRCI